MLLFIRMKKSISILIFILTLLFLPSIKGYSTYLYDLCYDYHPLKDGKIMFLRFKNSMLDPVLRTLEIYIFNPENSKLAFVPRYGEKIYLKPVVSHDQTTICYHSLIEGRDFLVTKNVEKGRNIRLSFDTGGYFLKLAIAYDDDTVAAVIKRGPNKQAIYYISNSKGLLKRLLNGKKFEKIDFLSEGSIFYIDNVDSKRISGYVDYQRQNTVIDKNIEFACPTPNGDSVVYVKNNRLILYRVSNHEKITILDNFIPSTAKIRDSIRFSDDGTAMAIITNDAIRIVNIPSGDVFYYISIDTQGSTFFMTNYSFYLSKDKKLFILMYKKPGQDMYKILESDENIRILGGNPSDKFLVYQKNNKKVIYIYDRLNKISLKRVFDFNIDSILYSANGKLFYIIAERVNKKDGVPIRELYLYDFEKELLYPVSTAKDNTLEPYKREVR